MRKVVYLDDAKIPYDLVQLHFQNIADWARTQCPSFVNYDLQDVSDVSLVYDHVASFLFNDPKDALLFELKWRTY
jgi:uncharacterized protein with NAD-binding domain and iron-sulfur cluster